MSRQLLCFFSLLHRLNYNAATNTYTPNAGVSVRVVGANGSAVKDVEFVGPIRIFPYFHKMVEYFVERGYVRDVSIRAAPYDWRFAAGIQQFSSPSMHAFKATAYSLVCKPMCFVFDFYILLCCCNLIDILPWYVGF